VLGVLAKYRDYVRMFKDWDHGSESEEEPEELDDDEKEALFEEETRGALVMWVDGWRELEPDDSDDEDEKGVEARAKRDGDYVNGLKALISLYKDSTNKPIFSDEIAVTRGRLSVGIVETITMVLRRTRKKAGEDGMAEILESVKGLSRMLHKIVAAHEESPKEYVAGVAKTGEGQDFDSDEEYFAQYIKDVKVALAYMVDAGWDEEEQEQEQDGKEELVEEGKESEHQSESNCRSSMKRPDNIEVAEEKSQGRVGAEDK